MPDEPLEEKLSAPFTSFHAQFHLSNLHPSPGQTATTHTRKNALPNEICYTTTNIHPASPPPWPIEGTHAPTFPTTHIYTHEQ